MCPGDDLVISDPKGGLSVGMIVATVLVLPGRNQRDAGMMASGGWFVSVVVVGRRCRAMCLVHSGSLASLYLW